MDNAVCCSWSVGHFRVLENQRSGLPQTTFWKRNDSSFFSQIVFTHMSQLSYSSLPFLFSNYLFEDLFIQMQLVNVLSFLKIR